MGTSVNLVAVLPAGAPAHRRSAVAASLEAAADWLGGAERVLSRFRPDSELSRLNAAAGHPCLVSALLLDVLRCALVAADETGGLYDPTVLPCVEAAGYAVSLPDLLAGPIPEGSRAVCWESRYGQVRIDDQLELVTLPPDCGLDFGGIAKGWVADTIGRLWHEPVPLAADLGGDMRIVLPAGYGSGWPVIVADPFTPARDLARLLLPSCGVATSSSVKRRWLTRQGWQHHIIDPRTALPAQSDLAQATVVAPTAALAEAWAKAVMILGSEAGSEFLARRPEAAALMVRHDGVCLATSNLEVYLDEFCGRQAGA